MHNPPHPGEMIRAQCLEPFGRSVAAAAKGPGVRRKALSEPLRGRSGVSPERAIRLFSAFGSSPKRRFRLQLQLDFASAAASGRTITVTRFSEPTPA
ncbi:MAG: HigA family addiction module antitoxin [Solidesulfovibrio sp. DCME]|uniref:HigA family addiction module antitoxin n=1 Tax=Solidesulfovibrio sp. DCME TaxID=3447380 RepID=UPI003D0ABEF8